MPTKKYYISAETDEVIRGKYLVAVEKYSQKFKVEKALIRAIVTVESQNNPFAMRYEPHLKKTEWYTNTLPEKYREDKYSYCSMGFMQVLFGIARSLGFKGTPQDLMDPDHSVHYGTKHLANFLKKYSKMEDAISSYNQGKPRKTADGKYKNQYYVTSVMRFYKQYKAAGTK